MRPQFRLVANSKDITAAIADRLVTLSYADEAGVDSDLLEIKLTDDPLAPIALPPRGAELELFLGYDGQAQRMGLFVCDEIGIEWPPNSLTIRARAAIYDGTPAGKKTLQTQKTRSWAQGTTLGAMVRKMAQEHGLQAAISASLASVALPHTDQTEESDISLLVRLAKRYDAVAKPAGGRLVFAKRGESKTISGVDLPTITVTPDMQTSGSVIIASRDAPGTVVAFWHSARQAARLQVSVGSGEPVRRLRNWFPTEAAALAAAQAELSRRVRGETRLTLNMPGRTDLTAEGTVVMQGFREGVAGTWLVSRVEHVLDGGGGYRCSVEGELPGAHADDAG